MSIEFNHKIFIACDHGGLELKNHLMDFFPQFKWVNLGSNTEESVDYPIYADLVANKLKDSQEGECGVLICGSGQGMAMRANKHSHIRAALCWNKEITKLSREHNKANILCLGGRFMCKVEAQEILKIFLETNFSGGRHERRVNLI